MSKSFQKTDQKCDVCGADGAFNVYDDLICAACFSDECASEEGENFPPAMTITREQFIKAKGREPENDDLERCNCDRAGTVGHSCCGWNRILNRPVFEVGPEDGLIQKPVASVVETVDVLRAIYARMNEGERVATDSTTVFVVGDGVFAYAATMESPPFAILIRDRRERTACGYLAQHLDRKDAPFTPLPVLRDDGAQGTTIIGSVRRIVYGPDHQFCNTVYLMLD